MGKLHKKVIAALRRELGSVRDLLDDIPDTGCVMGVVVSDAFLDLDHDKRQKMLWRALRNGGLTADELENVGPIATLTSLEATVKA